MKFRPIEWTNIKTGKISFGIQAKRPEDTRWLNCCYDSKPEIYSTKEERDITLSKMKIKSKKAKTVKIPPKAIEMRPCRLGDILVEKSWENGVKYQIKVSEPKSHPESGTTQDHNVLLTGYLFIPVNLSNSTCIDPVFRNGDKKVFGNKLISNWGCLHGNSRFFFIDKETQNIKQGIQELTELLENEAAIVNGVYEAHHKSRKELEEARNAIYAAYPVPVTKKESESEK